MDTLRFEWDPNKNEINKKKHGLSFEAAKEVFYDEFAILFDDPDILPFSRSTALRSAENSAASVITAGVRVC